MNPDPPLEDTGGITRPLKLSPWPFIIGALLGSIMAVAALIFAAPIQGRSTDKVHALQALLDDANATGIVLGQDNPHKTVDELVGWRGKWISDPQEKARLRALLTEERR